MKKQQSAWGLERAGHTPTEVLMLLLLAGIWVAVAIPIASTLPDPEHHWWVGGLVLVGGVAIVGVGMLAVYGEIGSGCIAAAGNLLVVPAAYFLASGAEAPERMVFWLAAPAAWNALALVVMVVEVAWSHVAHRS